MKIRKVDSKSIILHVNTDIKLKTAGNTLEVQFYEGVNKRCPIQNISKDKYYEMMIYPIKQESYNHFFLEQVVIELLLPNTEYFIFVQIVNLPTGEKN